MTVHLPDTRPRLFRHKRGVDRELGHQLTDKALLAQAGQAVGFVEIHGEEVFPQALPEGTNVVLVEHAAHLGQHFLRKAVAELGNEQPACFGKQRTVTQVFVGLAAILRAQKQRAHLGVAGMVGAQEQRIDGAMQIELYRRVRQRAKPVVVERHFTPYLAFDGATTC